MLLNGQEQTITCRTIKKDTNADKYKALVQNIQNLLFIDPWDEANIEW